MKKTFRLLRMATLMGLIMAGAFTLPLTVYADDKAEAAQLIEKAKLTFQNFMTDPSMGVMRDLMKDAKGVFIMPQLLRGAYVIGISGGSGVLFSREGKSKWKGPAFYTVGGAGIGLQIGGESSEVILLIMTERGVTAFLSDNFKLGGDADVALGPVGMGIAAQTANLSGDILSFSRSKGLYGGVSLQGAVVASREGMNSAYYSEKTISPADILIRAKDTTNPRAVGLREAIAKAAEK